MTTILFIAVGYLVFTLVVTIYAYWPDGQDKKVERAVADELYRRQFESKVDAEVARRERDEKGGQK